ncbi:hypothetical protein DESUT3_19080 [Desulfuromonas versatilis]|uniref:Uncharacterized protein n=1 Tax=Desulfuromonas versatilis TaxID=2802975 RepID=A0ABM8HWC4_9BACT|nr:hypothetical protein [Desulfuromonas versatilis]BCR04839.1 hypothetical protein DESUT3_19080 [Desulfuromonas versatilis]
MSAKNISVVFYGRRFLKQDWNYEIDEQAFAEFFARLREEFAGFDIQLDHQREEDLVLDVKGYGDLLNCVRIRSPRDGFGNLCLGHIIGASPNRDLFEDIRRGVSRVAFAPETVEPEGSNKVVCHNCGCGC